MLAPTYSPSKEVPSAMEGLTAVFGMRTGGPLPLKHQHTTLNYLIFNSDSIMNFVEGTREGMVGRDRPGKVGKLMEG